MTKLVDQSLTDKSGGAGDKGRERNVQRNVDLVIDDGGMLGDGWNRAWSPCWWDSIKLPVHDTPEGCLEFGGGPEGVD